MEGKSHERCSKKKTIQKNKGGRDRDVPEVVGRLRAGLAQLFVCFGGVEDTSKERRLINCYFTSLIKQAFNAAFESQVLLIKRMIEI